MTGKRGKTGNPGQRRHWAGPGRNPTKAILKEGVIVFISQVWPNEDNVDLGRGIVGEIKRLKGGDRCVVIPQPDGSELRIVIGMDE